MLAGVSFGGASVPADCVVRTFRVKVMSTPAKRRQAQALLMAGGDVWAWCIDRYHARRGRSYRRRIRTPSCGRTYVSTAPLEP